MLLAQVEVGIAEGLRLVEGGGLVDVGHIAREAFYLVDGKGVRAVVDDTVGPALYAQEESPLVGHGLLANVEARGVWVEGSVRKEHRPRKRHLRLVGVAGRGLQHAVNLASGLHGLDAAVPVVVRIDVALAQEELDEPAHRRSQCTHAASSRA